MTTEYLQNAYKGEWEYISSKYPDTDEFTKLDYLKQIISHSETVGKKYNKKMLSKIPVGWNATPLFKQYILEENEYDEYMENPLGNEMHDSVVSCGKCGSGKTFNIEKQTRSLDEPSTIITICYDCKHRHKYSG